MNIWMKWWNNKEYNDNKMKWWNVIKSMIMMKWMNDDEYEWNKMNMKEWWWIWMDNGW